jgi:hypothetical protein
MDKKNEGLESAPFYLVSNWDKIMPNGFDLTSWYSEQRITPEESRYDSMEQKMLRLNGMMAGSFRWWEVDLTPQKIRALNGLDFKKLKTLSLKIYLGAENSTSYFQVLPNLRDTAGLYDFGVELIDSHFMSGLPRAFRACCEAHKDEHFGCGLSYNVTIEGTPSKVYEVKGLGTFVGQISDLREIMVPRLQAYVSAEKRFQREIRKRFRMNR